jgi:hypothetical protein
LKTCDFRATACRVFWKSALRILAAAPGLDRRLVCASVRRSTLPVLALSVMRTRTISTPNRTDFGSCSRRFAVALMPVADALAAVLAGAEPPASPWQNGFADHWIRMRRSPAKSASS